MYNNAIEISGFSKHYNEFSIENMNMSIPRGYITGFIGRNGAGKTTTIRAILNMIKPDSGKIEVLGTDVSKDDPSLKNRLGIVPGTECFIGKINVESYEKCIAPFYDNWDSKKFNEYLKRFEISKSKKISELSQGMKVKLALSAALSHNAELFILDEPTAGLDPIIRNDILDVFSELIQNENMTILFSTHITSDLDKTADFVVMIDGGRIVFNSSKDELIESHVLVKGGADCLTQKLKSRLIGCDENRYGFVGLAKSGTPLTDGISTEKPNIEDIMVYYSKSLEEAAL